MVLRLAPVVGTVVYHTSFFPQLSPEIKAHWNARADPRSYMKK